MGFQLAFVALPYDLSQVSYTPRNLHSPRFAILFLSHSHSLTMARYFQVSVPSHRPQEIGKEAYSMHVTTYHQNRTDIYNASIKHKASNTRRRTLSETTGYDSKTTQGSESSWKRLAERVPVVFSRLEYGYRSFRQSVTHLGKLVW